MIQTLRVTNPLGNTLQLDLDSSLDDHGILVFNLTGLGPPKAVINAIGGPAYDGTDVNLVRTDPRHIVLTLAIPRGGTTEETAKQKIYTYFPIKQEIIFRVTTGTKDAYIMAYVESNEANQFAKVENFVIGLYCQKPYFIDMTEDSETGIAYTGSTITYGGEVNTGMTLDMSFSGYVGDWVSITNESYLGSKTIYVDLTYAEDVLGSANHSGDGLLINTRFGEKGIWFVRSSINYPILGYVPVTSTWINLHPDDNDISFSATTPANASLDIYYSNLYEGV